MKARCVGVVVTLFHLADHFFGSVKAVGEMAVVLLIAGFVSAAFKFVDGGASWCQCDQFRLRSHRGEVELPLVMAHQAQSMSYPISRFSVLSRSASRLWCSGFPGGCVLSDPGGRHRTVQKIQGCERAVENCSFPARSRECHGWGSAQVFAWIRSSHR